MKTKTNESGSTTKSKSSKETLEDIFEDMLKDIYWAEKNLLKALPKMAKASHSEELTEAFNLHLEQTQVQIERIEECFKILEKKATASTCEAMKGLIKEGEETIEKYEKGHARDAAIIAAAQKMEHYEISAYGTMRTMANVLAKTKCATLLEKTKDEEAETDANLTTLAEKINQLAAEMETVEVE